MHKYYPLDFEYDMNGKKNDWEAVVIIPYVSFFTLSLSFAFLHKLILSCLYVLIFSKLNYFFFKT